MRKLFIFLCLICISGCTNRFKFIDLEKDIKYSLVADNVTLLTFESPIGSWNNLRINNQPKDIIARDTTILNGRPQFAWVGYEVRLALQNIETIPKRKSIFSAVLHTGDTAALFREMDNAYYGEKRLKETGITDIKRGFTKIAGYQCIWISETQGLGPRISDEQYGDAHITRKTTDIFCPLLIDGEVWELFSSQSFQIADKNFYEYYGDDAPSFEVIEKDLRARLQPMYDSIVVYRNPSQLALNQSVENREYNK